MRTEVLILCLAVVLGFIQLFAATAAETKVRGMKFNASSRDEEVPPLKGTPGRLKRAFENFKETFPFFLAAVFVVTYQDKTGAVSAAGAMTYLIARTVYIFLYVNNVIYVRSIVWLISVLGIFAVFLQNFL